MGDSIELQPGESTKVISQPPGPNVAYNVDVDGKPGDEVYAHHQPGGIQREGDRYLAGDRPTIKNLGGSPVYMKAARGNSGGIRARVSQDTDTGFESVYAPRRQVDIDTTVNTDNNVSGASFDTGAGDTYPVSLSNPDGPIRAIDLSILTGEVEVAITTTGGDTVTLPVNSPASIDTFEVDSAEIKDGGTTPRVAGGWSGE